MTRFYVGLGSNVAPRRRAIEEALGRLLEVDSLVLESVSLLRETEHVPVSRGEPAQDKFLNGVCRLSAERSPEEMLMELLAIEEAGGRVRDSAHGPRTIDLDLLLAGHERRAGDNLTLPHPRMGERAFVLEPLAEVLHPDDADLPARMGVTEEAL